MRVRHGRDERAPLSAEADVVVVGSGSGGAIVARELVRAGLDVIVLEEGGHHPPSAYAKHTPTETLRRMVREAGLGIAMGLGDTPLISVMAGRCVGGSSALTGGVCFRIPNDVLRGWSTDLKLTDMTPDALAPYFDELERDLSVETVPESLRSRSTELFVEGADKLGIVMKPLRRNTPTCKGASRCNFGCPNHAKKSVDVAVLPEVTDRGSLIISDALVSHVIVERGVARGVRGHFLHEDGARVPFEIRARAVVVACGSLHTPQLLQRSGAATSAVGKNLTLHPGFRVGALFDERVDGWDGAMQSVYSDHFADDGLTLLGIYAVPNVLATAFPGVGPAHRRIVKSLPHLAFFGAMVHDEAGGRVRRWLSREPLLTYRMARRDRERMWRGVKILGEMAFAAGARQVLLPIFGIEPIRRVEDLRALVDTPPPARRVECMSFHPLGSARMSVSPELGAVKPTGESWRVDNLFVTDGSVLPSSIGVNSQLPIMAIAMRLGREIAARFDTYARRAA